MSKTLLFIGVMSGSSLDGIDVALTEFTNTSIKVVATHFQPYSNTIKTALLDLHFPSDNELEKSALMANQLARLYGEAINTLLAENGLIASQISAIGCHGQTIRHKPLDGNDVGYSIQLGNNALLAELTNITVVGDFRSRDIAAGGQGAPLVPAFHQAVFAIDNKNRAIINIGGIANITFLARSGEVLGFDSGPGNILIDHWVRLKLGKSYDADGLWASTGTVHQALLERMLTDPFFALPPPKSTGRDLFNAAWLDQHLQNIDCRDEDIARTLVEMTCHSIYQAITQYCPDINEVYLCGGGTHNNLIQLTLQSKLSHLTLSTTDALGVNVDWVEAAAFAWLAQQTLKNEPSNLPSVTGASGLRILGAIYLA
jgi:anhydro-N-acetylmuramic acid kinase